MKLSILISNYQSFLLSRRFCSNLTNLSNLNVVLCPLLIKSVYSHMACADTPQHPMNLQQIELFKEICAQIQHSLPYTFIRHLLNSEGAAHFPNAQFDMVRLGLGLYGINNENQKELQPVGVLKSHISQIRTVKKGETVGYNRAFKANSTIKTATIPIGHADGISRQFSSGNGYVYIKNKKAPIVGNVCMDMIMVNITDINCNEGDEVLVYKNQFHIEELAKSINTISYEILTAISQRVTRIVN